MNMHRQRAKAVQALWAEGEVEEEPPVDGHDGLPTWCGDPSRYRLALSRSVERLAAANHSSAGSMTRL
jgi:hypothetical protein